MRLSPAITFIALFACASAVSAQSSPAPLSPHAGSPFAYRIGLPGGWKVERQDVKGSRDVQVQAGSNTDTVRVDVQGEMVTAVSGTAYIGLLVADMLPVKNSELPISWGEQRRIMTSSILGSDSLLFAVMSRTAGRPDFRNVVREIRTLGGQRSGYLKGLHSFQGSDARIEIHVTVNNGVVYVLTMAEAVPEFDAREPLFARVRESIVFAENVPGSAPR